MKAIFILASILVTSPSFAYFVQPYGSYFILYCKSQHPDGDGIYRYDPSYNRYNSESEAYAAGKNCPYGIHSVKPGSSTAKGKGSAQ